MSMRSKFLVFGAVPVTVLAVTGAAAFTFGQDISQINGTQEQSDYLVVATNATSDSNNWHQKAYIGGAAGLTGSLQDVTVATKYGELPQWFQVDSGASGVPSAVQEPGDLAFINGASSTTTPADTNNGNQGGGTNNFNVVQAIHVKGNITNVAALRQTYGTCLIPIRLWKTTNDGGAFTDVTQTYLDTQNRLSDGTNGQTPSTANPSGSGTDPLYVDCTTGEFEFTVPTDAAADHKTDETLAYELSVERGGVFGTFNNNTGAQPEFVFQATPIAYDPTNQFNTPGANGNRQYTPNIKPAASVVPPATGAMTLSVHIAANPTTVAMPLYGTVTDISIDWGDGTTTGPFNAAGNQSHDYTTPGDYTISITGTKLQTFGDKDQTVTGVGTITAVTSWGNLGLEGLDSAFACATSLTSLPSSLPSTVTSLYDTFEGANHFNQDISGWDTSNVTSMNRMFAAEFWDFDCGDNGPMAFNQNIGSWNTANVTDMAEMFGGNSTFNQPIGAWNTANVTGMGSMFYLATSFNQPLGGWNTSNVIDMGNMFFGASAFNQNLAGLEINSVGGTPSNPRRFALWSALSYSGMSSANYSSTLVGWQSQSHQSNLYFGAEGVNYLSTASAARAALVADGWTITDAGLTS